MIVLRIFWFIQQFVPAIFILELIVVSVQNVLSYDYNYLLNITMGDRKLTDNRETPVIMVILTNNIAKYLLGYCNLKVDKNEFYVSISQ